MKIEKREPSLLGLIVPVKWRYFREIVKGWEYAFADPSINKRPEELVWIEFDFTKIKKGRIYRDLACAIRNSYFQTTMKALAIYLSKNSNLADNEILETRVNTIYHNIKKYKTVYR